MMRFGTIIYDGRRFSDFSVKMAICKNRYEVPKPSVDVSHLDGRNGDLLYFIGDYENIELNYLCVCDGDFDTNFNALKSWIYSDIGYHRLEDDADPDVYRQAAVLDVTEITSHRDCFNIKFNCRPQKFLKIGEKPRKYTSSGTIYNPTDYASRPLLKITGTGDITINGTIIRVQRNSSYMMIDCETMDAYRGSSNLNSDIWLVTGDFFELAPKTNSITIPSGMTVEITPRWWQV